MTFTWPPAANGPLLLEVGELGYLQNHSIPEGMIESPSTSSGFSF